MSIGRTLRYPVAALLGVAVCLLLAALANLFHVTPRFPAFGGDADFDFRVSVFLFAVVPGFAALGLFSAYACRTGAAATSLLAVLGASLLVAAVGKALAFVLENLPSRASANAAAIAYLCVWLVACWLGVAFTSLRARRRAKSE